MSNIIYLVVLYLLSSCKSLPEYDKNGYKHILTKHSSPFCSYLFNSYSDLNGDSKYNLEDRYYQTLFLCSYKFTRYETDECVEVIKNRLWMNKLTQYSTTYRFYDKKDCTGRIINSIINEEEIYYYSPYIFFIERNILMKGKI